MASIFHINQLSKLVWKHEIVLYETMVTKISSYVLVDHMKHWFCKTSKLIYWKLKLFNPMCHGLLGPDRFMGEGYKVPGFILRALNCCLTLKRCICFQKYKLTSHEEKYWSKSQKVNEILRFENFMDLTFCHNLTHKNGRNSLSLWDTGFIFWI